MWASSGVLNQGSAKRFLIIGPKKKKVQKKQKVSFKTTFMLKIYRKKVKSSLNFFDLHTKVRHTAGHKRIGVNVFMTGQKWKEE